MDKHGKWLRVFSKDWQPTMTERRFRPTPDAAILAMAQLDPLKVAYTTDDLAKLLDRHGVAMPHVHRIRRRASNTSDPTVEGLPSYDEAILPTLVDADKPLKTACDVLLALDQLGVTVPHVSLPPTPAEREDGEWHSIFSRKWQPKRQPSMSAAQLHTSLLGIKLESLAESDILDLLRRWGVVTK